MRRVKINFLIPTANIILYNKKYYSPRPYIINELSKYLDIVYFSKVDSVKTIDTRTHIECDKNIKFVDTKFPSQYEYYKLKTTLKKIKTRIGSEPIFTHSIFPLWNFYIRLIFNENPNFFWVKSLFETQINPAKLIIGYENYFKTTVRIIGYPFLKRYYDIYSKITTKQSIVFFTGPANFDIKNHLNKIEFVSSSPTPNNFTLPLKKNFSGKIIFIGKNVRQKGFDLLLNALLEMQNPPELIVVGMDALNDMQLQRFSMLRIIFMGRIFNRKILYDIIKDCDFLVMPAFFEKQGKTQVEAQLAGVVPICSDSGGIYTTVKNYYNGILFKEGSYQDLKKTLVRAYSNFAIYNHIRNNCIEESKSMTIEKQGKIISEVIKNSIYLTKHN